MQEARMLPKDWYVAYKENKEIDVLVSPTGYKFYPNGKEPQEFINQSLQAYLEMEFMAGL